MDSPELSNGLVDLTNNTNLTYLMTNALASYCAGQYKIYTSPGDIYLSLIQKAVGDE